MAARRALGLAAALLLAAPGAALAGEVRVAKQVEADGTTRGYPDNAGGQALFAFCEGSNKETLDNLRARFATGPVDWAARLRR